MDAALTADPLMIAQFRLPQSEGRALAALERGATLSGQRYEGNLLFFRAEGPTSLLERYRRFYARESSREAQVAVTSEAR